MKTTRMRFLLAGLTLIVAVGTTRTGTAEQPHAHAPVEGVEVVVFERDMDKSMTRMMADMHSGGYTGNVDIDFLAMMIPHHAGAVDMARLVLHHGRDPVTRQLAEEIIAGQTIEIESMMRRLNILRDAAPTSSSEFPSLGGIRGP